MENPSSVARVSKAERPVENFMGLRRGFEFRQKSIRPGLGHDRDTAEAVENNVALKRTLVVPGAGGRKSLRKATMPDNNAFSAKPGEGCWKGEQSKGIGAGWSSPHGLPYQTRVMEAGTNYTRRINQLSRYFELELTRNIPLQEGWRLIMME